MSTEVSRADRLLRKRNQCLQHQLDVRIQIFDKEFKMCKSRTNSEIRDCNTFYKTIRGVYPGLENYSQPDTKSMAEQFKRKQKQAKLNPSKTGSGGRYTVGDSRHIARANKSQIETSIYSTFTQGDQHPNNSKPDEPTEHIQNIVKQKEQERRHSESRRLSAQASNSRKSSLHSNHSSSTSSNNSNETAQEYEHPITTLVRTMRRRIYSAPGYRKVQFHSQISKDFRISRPQTAIGCVQEQSSCVVSNVDDDSDDDNDSILAIKRRMSRNTIARPHTTATGCHKTNEPTAPTSLKLSKDSPLIHNKNQLIKTMNHAVAESDFIRRPKSAPPNYELLGKSPALPRQQVAGIMAELESRCAATRALIDKSRLIQKQVKKIITEQGIQDENDSNDEG